MTKATHGYTMEIDPLHRNDWPITLDGRVVGTVTEHIAVALDGMEPPKTDWSWTLADAEASRLGRHWINATQSTLRYARHEEAFETFVGLHRLAHNSLTKSKAVLG